MSESYRDILGKLVDAQRETATATIVLAENVAALREALLEINRQNMALAERTTVAIERVADDPGTDGMDS